MPFVSFPYLFDIHELEFHLFESAGFVQIKPLIVRGS
jgi:hypothetical protein